MKLSFLILTSRSIPSLLFSFRILIQSLKLSRKNIMSANAKPVYRIITNLQPVFISFRPKNSTSSSFVSENDGYEGYLKDLIQKLSELVGFDYALDHIIWYDNFTGKNPAIPQDYGGMLGQLVRNEADLVLADLTITKSRLSIVHFSYPFYISGYSIITYRTQAEDWRFEIWNFLNPFQIQTWAYILLACGILCLIRVGHLYGIENVLNNSATNKSLQSFNLKQFFNHMYKLVFGNELEFNTVSGTLLSVTWKIFKFILISCYAANLAAFMTINRMRQPINSVNDLVDQSLIEYDTSRKSAVMEFLQHSTVPVYQKLYQHFTLANEKDNETKVFYNVVDKVRAAKGKYAHIAETVNIDYFASRQPCDLVRVGESFDSRGLGIAMRLDLPFEFKREIDLRILELLETGWLHDLEQKWWYNNNECDPNKQKDALNNQQTTEGLTITKLGGVFFILCFGIGISILIGLGELFINHRHNIRDLQTSVTELKRNNENTLLQFVEVHNGAHNHKYPKITLSNKF